MKTTDVTVVRIYITESSHLLNVIIHYLKNDIKVRGCSVFRAIDGFGETGSHTNTLFENGHDAPLMIEFFDEDKNTIEKALDGLSKIVKPEHIVIWEAKVNI